MATPTTVGKAAGCILMNALGIPPDRAFALVSASGYDRVIADRQAEAAFIAACWRIYRAQTGPGLTDEELFELVAKSIDGATKNFASWAATRVAATWIGIGIHFRSRRRYKRSPYDD